MADSFLKGNNMGKQKFHSCLASKVREDKEFEDNQEKLKKKYGIAQGKKIVVVEKSNMFKFLIKTLFAIIRLLATIALLAMAIIGILAMVYPDTRDILWHIAQTLLIELRQYLQ